MVYQVRKIARFLLITMILSAMLPFTMSNGQSGVFNYNAYDWEEKQLDYEKSTLEEEIISTEVIYKMGSDNSREIISNKRYRKLEVRNADFRSNVGEGIDIVETLNKAEHIKELILGTVMGFKLNLNPLAIEYKELKHINKVSVVLTDFDESSLWSLLSDMPNLQHLFIGSRSTKTIDVTDDFVKLCNRLQSVSFQNIVFTEIVDLSSLDKLTSLAIRYHSTTDSVGANSFIASFSTCSTIRDFRLVNKSYKLGLDPRSVDGFQNLEYLDIEIRNRKNNKLSIVPFIGNNKGLRRLKLDCAYPMDLQGISDFKVLDTLKVKFNGRGNEEFMSDLYNIESLKFLDLKCDTIRPEIRNLSRLEVGRFRGAIRTVPEELFSLNELRHLSLLDTRLESISDGISRLGKLKNLVLVSRTLKELPQSIGKVGSLERLIVDSYALGDVQESIFNLGRLRSLSLTCNAKRVPDGFKNLKQLEFLQLRSRGLIELPRSVSQLKNLKSLFVEMDEQNVGVKLFPKALSRLANLKYFNFENNKLTKNELANLILSLNGKNSARLSVNFNDCNITALPDLDWGGIKFKRLTFERNKISLLPESFLNAPMENISLALNSPSIGFVVDRPSLLTYGLLNAYLSIDDLEDTEGVVIALSKFYEDGYSPFNDDLKYIDLALQVDSVKTVEHFPVDITIMRMKTKGQADALNDVYNFYRSEIDSIHILKSDIKHVDQFLGEPIYDLLINQYSVSDTSSLRQNLSFYSSKVDSMLNYVESNGICVQNHLMYTDLVQLGMLYSKVDKIESEVLFSKAEMNLKELIDSKNSISSKLDILELYLVSNNFSAFEESYIESITTDDMNLGNKYILEVLLDTKLLASQKESNYKFDENKKMTMPSSLGWNFNLLFNYMELSGHDIEEFVKKWLRR